MLTHKRRLALRLVQLEAIQVNRVSGAVMYEEKGSSVCFPQRPFRWLLRKRYIMLAWYQVGSSAGVAVITTRGVAAL